MYKSLHNTFAEDASCMTTVTDEEIKKNGGEAKLPFLIPEDLDSKGNDLKLAGTVVDPKIFGTLEEASTKKMGYYVLPAPVVNVNWVTGTYPLLDSMLHMSPDTLNKIVHFGYSVETEDSENGKYKTGKVFKSEKERRAAVQDGAVTGSGPEAVIALMKYYGIENTGIIHNVVPILPLGVRYIKRDNGSYSKFGIEPLLDNVIVASERYKNIKNLSDKEGSFPSIILENSYRMLQEAVDKYINNGANQNGISTQYGMPTESLHEFYKFISSYTVNKITSTPDFSEVHESLIEEMNNYHKLVMDRYKLMNSNTDNNEETNQEYVESDEEKEINKKIDELSRKMRKYFLRNSVRDWFLREYKYYDDFFENMFDVFCTSIEDSLQDIRMPMTDEETFVDDEKLELIAKNAAKCVAFYVEKYTPFQTPNDTKGTFWDMQNYYQKMVSKKLEEMYNG